jgi:hypothetical protein
MSTGISRLVDSGSHVCGFAAGLLTWTGARLPELCSARAGLAFHAAAQRMIHTMNDRQIAIPLKMLVLPKYW